MNQLFLFCLALISAFVIAGCQTTSSTGTQYAAIENPPLPSKKPAVPLGVKYGTSSDDYYKIAQQIQCVPYARKVSGIPIRGNAYTWWPQAKGRFERSKDTPQVGSVMVLSKTDRLIYGHVAVVKAVIDDRTIEVEHANWGGTMPERKIVYERMPVKDVSANNDWSRARFFHYPSQTFGSVYPVTGFVMPHTYLADAGDVVQ